MVITNKEVTMRVTNKKECASCGLPLEKLTRKEGTGMKPASAIGLPADVYGGRVQGALTLVCECGYEQFGLVKSVGSDYAVFDIVDPEKQKEIDTAMGKLATKLDNDGETEYEIVESNGKKVVLTEEEYIARTNLKALSVAELNAMDYNDIRSECKKANIKLPRYTKQVDAITLIQDANL